MRFMMLVIPEGYGDAERGTVPDDVEAVRHMMEYNEALQKAGVLLALDGLHPPAERCPEARVPVLRAGFRDSPPR